MLLGSAVAASVLLVGMPLLAQTADGTTARVALQDAIVVARKWQPDAVLTSVSGTRATPDGKAKKWGYMFYSAKAKKGYSVDFAGSKLTDQMEVRPHITDGVTPDFIDSDKAIAVARANGVDTKGQPIVMSLLVMGQSTKAPASAWTVGGGFQPGAVAVVVDAKSGKFMFKQAVPK